MPSLPVIIADAVICGLISAGISNSRGQGSRGGILGLILGPLGVLLCLTMKTTPAAAAARAEAIEAERRKLRGEAPAQDSQLHE